MKSLVRKNAKICLLSLQQHSVLQKRGKRKKKNIKETIEVLLGCKFSSKSNLLLFCRLCLFGECLWDLHCADGHALSLGKGGEVNGEGSGVVSSWDEGPWAVSVPIWPEGEEGLLQAQLYGGMHLLRRNCLSSELAAHGWNVRSNASHSGLLLSSNKSSPISCIHVSPHS